MEMGNIQNPISHKPENWNRSDVNSELQNTIVFNLNATEDSGQTIASCVHSHQSVELFLRFMGIIWKTEKSTVLENCIQYTWNLIIRGGLLSLLVYSLLTFLFVIIKWNQYSATLDGFAVLLSVTVFLQCMALFFALHNIQSRMNQNATMSFVSHLSDGLKPSYRVLCITFSIAIIPLYYVFLHPPFSFLYVYLIGEVGACCILTATMYFISTDCIVAASLLDELLEQQRKESLTYEQYSSVCTVVENCKSRSRWINNSIVVVAFLDIAAVLLFLFAMARRVPLFGVLEILAMLLKEIPFLMVVYWQVAKVNEKYAKFMKLLGGALWNTEPNSDNKRMAIYIKAQSNPIVMSLAGMKLKRKDLAWQFALWCFAFVVSIVKAAVIHEV